jgi:hypothetical protein
MTGSTMPLAAQFSSHPVHRATDLLRQALDKPPQAAPDPAELWDALLFRLDPAPIELARGPVSVTTPNDSLVTLLGFAPFEYAHLECQPPVTDTADVGAAKSGDGEGEDMLDHAVQAQLQGLVQAFHRRQRQASLLVACSIAAAVILTLAGLLLLFGTTSPGRADKAAPQSEKTSARDTPHATSAVPALAPIRVSDTIDAGADAKIIVARAAQPLALGPLLPIGVARYILLRGLPEDASLSAGRRTGAGTWMVKGEDIPGLTLTFGDGARGDYPTEIYLLDSQHGPQARRRMILRVDPSPQVYAAGLALGWPTAFFQVPQTQEPAEAVAEAAPAPMDATPRQGSGSGHPASAEMVTVRRLLTDRAENGQADAAYELALTYDVEVLARAVIETIEGDMLTARAWYMRAAQAGHAGATRRLEMIARRPAGA